MIAALAAAAVASVGCSDRSEADFPGAYRGAANVVAGPVAFVGAGAPAREALPGDVLPRGGYKSPLLIRNRHAATISVAPGYRRLARLRYRHESAPFAELPAKLRARGCRSGSGSRSGGRGVTFWSGDIALREMPACVEILVRSGGGPIRRALRFGTGASPPSAGPRRCR